MTTKDLFFEVEQRYNAPLTTGQINELEARKMRHVSTGDYVTTQSAAKPKQSSKSKAAKKSSSKKYKGSSKMFSYHGEPPNSANMADDIIF